MEINLKDISDKDLLDIAESLLDELSERSNKCSKRIDELVQAHKGFN